MTVVELSEGRGFGYVMDQEGNQLLVDLFTNGVDVSDLEVGISIFCAVDSDGRVTDVIDS